MTGSSYISGWFRKPHLKHLQPTGFEDRIDTGIRALQQCKVVECMCKDMVHFNALWWLQMIPTHWFSLPYVLGKQTMTRCLAAPPGTLR